MTDPLARIEVAAVPGGGQLVTIHGEVDASNATDLERRIILAVRPGRRVLLDLGKVEYLDSQGLRLVLAVAAHVRADGGELIVVAPEGSFAAELLAIAQLRDVVRVVGSSADVGVGPGEPR